ncbi:uridine 5'-monophosphate synthase [Folsomia candida]|uniref:Uridine 5'-monophosphate synthase n=1 Tax=Folsomia candida TaxID=158441 RepID=A0A226DNE0_FOLCA|nr:uridine 5'-monophosphate synthase [Folsomia candida]OXA46719.1 Uridine 5'-monophosphate synthase [Folsomia candida]
MDTNKIESLIVSLFKVDGVKFGSFTLKSGLVSPVYFDLRVIVSYPEILKTVSDLVGEEVARHKAAENVDLICGVPYTALPVASLVSVTQGVPMVLKRKEQKTYGTGNLVEGSFSPGDRCILIEDVVTSGGSVVETADALRHIGLKVDHAIVILDRCQGADFHLARNGVGFTALIRMEQLLNVLLGKGLIDSRQRDQVVTFLAENQLFDPAFADVVSKKFLPRVKCPLSVKLVGIMEKKSSNLCLSVDLGGWEEVLEAVEAVGSKVCMVKTHVDTIGLKGVKVIAEFWGKLKALSIKHDFLIMEDRKFGDIGSTTLEQLKSKPFEISKWADLVTVHGISGPGVLTAIEKLGLGDKFGAVLIAEMSSENNIPSLLPEYKNLIYKMAEGEYSPLVAGFVSQARPLAGNSTPYALQFTPGVSLNSGTGGDGLGQVYNSVENAVLLRGADVIIVGRGILAQPKAEWTQVAEQFRTRGWAAFKERISSTFD